MGRPFDGAEEPAGYRDPSVEDDSDEDSQASGEEEGDWDTDSEEE